MSKLVIENILEDYSNAYNFNYISLRYFNAAGSDPEINLSEKHDPETHLIPLLLEVAAEQRDKFYIYGDDYDTKDGTCIRDFIHVNDLARAHEMALKDILKNNYSNSFNLGNQLGFSILEVIKIVEKVTSKTIPYIVQDRRSGDPEILIGSNKKIKEIYGWEPYYQTLEEIVKTAWIWKK